MTLDLLPPSARRERTVRCWARCSIAFSRRLDALALRPATTGTSRGTGTRSTIPNGSAAPTAKVRADFRGQRRSNATHRSVTDPDARLAKKGAGKEAKLSYQASVLLENRYGLVVATTVSAPSGTAEVDQAIELCATQPPRAGRRTLGADKGYDQRSLITGLRGLGWIPHIAQGPTRILDGRTTRHAGYATSQQRRKRIEESFGWGKTVGLLRKLRHRGRELVDWIFTFTMAAYNLVRLRTLIDVGVST